MKHLILLLVVHLCLHATPAILAQQKFPEPEKWGNVSNEHLKMTIYPRDSAAAALILYDYGSLEESGGGWTLKIHHRVKILNESAIERFGKVRLTYDEDEGESIREIKAATIVLAPSGKTEIYEVDSDMIYDEKVDDKGTRQKRFAFPKITVGSVLEYAYEHNYKYYPIIRWRFQSDEPVLWSEVRLQAPNVIQMAYLRRGYRIFDIQEKIPYSTRAFKGEVQRYVMKNVRALRDEPFMLPKHQLRSAIELLPFGAGGRKFIESWKEYNDALAKAFKALAGDGKRFKALADSLAGGITDSEQKLRTIGEFAQKNLRVRKLVEGEKLSSEKITADSSFLSVININFTLVEMLRSAGIEAYPLLVSSERNGSGQKINPAFANAFDRVMVVASINNARRVLDATDTCRPIDLLPAEVLYSEGLIVKEGANDEWLQFNPQKNYKRRFELTLSEFTDTAANGSLKVTLEDYSAVAARKKMTQISEAEYVKSLMKSNAVDIEYDNFLIRNRFDLSKPLEIALTVSLRNPQTSDEFIYLNPILVGRIEKNPFTQNERVYPIDMGYPVSEEFIFRMQVPQGFSVKEQPMNTLITYPDGKSVQYQRRVAEKDNIVEVRTSFALNRDYYQAEEHNALKQVYDQIVQAESEQIVLQKKPTESKPASRKSSGKKKK